CAKRPRRGHCRYSRGRKNAADTIFSDDSGRRARRKCDGAGAGCRLCVAFGTRGHSRRARCGNHRARGQGSSLYEGPVNTRSAHDVRFNRRGRDAKLHHPDLDDWIARVKARGHTMLGEKQLKFHIERYGNIAHSWSSYALYSDGKQVARGINSIQAIKEVGGWRVTGIMVQAESVSAPLRKEYLP